MKGFKATYNLKCRDVQFEVGKTYKIEGKLEMCKNGFHFCKDIRDTLYYYNPNNNLVFLEIEALGEVITEGNKSCTDEIKILRVIDRSEIDFIKWDDRDNVIYREYSSGYWYKQEFDQNNNQIYFEDSDGYWAKREFDKNKNEIYFENSAGKIIDNRPKNS